MNNNNVKGTSALRQKNRIQIIDYIRKNAPVTRIDIFNGTKISRPTITRIVKQLVEEKIVEESGIVETHAGRKPIYLKLRKSALCCLGMNIYRNSITASIIDLDKNILISRKDSISDVQSEEEFLECILRMIYKLIDESNILINHVIGIGIGSSGVVDYDKGILLNFNPYLNIRNIHLKDFLEGELDIPTFVDNNPNTRALGEYWYGYGKGHRNIAYIVCGEGIGSGIIADGNILRGKNNITGEFGHMTVAVNGRQCNCGRKGCVEAYCSTEQIEKILMEDLIKVDKSPIMDYCKENDEVLSYSLICEFYEKDIFCKKVIDQAVEILSIGLSNLMGILNSEIIILSGELFENNFVFEQVVARTKKNVFTKSIGNIEFKKREQMDYVYEIGAGALVYKSYFKNV
ncbi:transcriptional regulator [Vallitalea longa]|uniref:Transcriptional regulator n=1 Tax=Vallitalea longa TaxID=2936439 RepID=A0A9W6DHJ6_9FIRM|nr:ROK family transcriptional regulator [Vallitalea longa]GKX31637.1 transcriptional regulator [Vallitalea longa]